MSVFQKALLALTVMAVAPPVVAAQGELPEGDGKTLIQQTCGACHGIDLVTSKRGTREEWEITVKTMNEYGAGLAEADAATVLNYLVKNFGAAPAAETRTAPATTTTTTPAAPASDKYTVNKEWAKLPAGMTWDASTSYIAADGKGNVVVLVRTAPYFRVFNRDGQFVKAWGDAGTFREAHSVMFDREGFIWATDSNGHAVYKFDADGKLLMTLGKRDMPGDDTSRDLFNRPNAVAVTANGDIFVSDGYTNSRVVQFTKDGEFVRIIGGVKGSQPGQLQLPHSVVVDSNGRVIVGDSDNRRVSVFDREGKFIETWDFPSRGGMVITPDDTVYISDVNAGAINVVKDGKLIETIGGLGRPHGITLDSDGAIYASDSANRTVMKITPKN